MNKTIALLAALVMAVSLAACGGKNAAVKEAESLISAIDTVSIDSGQAINSAKAAYDSLSEKERGMVENYAVLSAAETDYTAAIEAKRIADEAIRLAEKEAARIAKEETARIAEEKALRLDEERTVLTFAAEMIGDIKRGAKNPHSFIIYKLMFAYNKSVLYTPSQFDYSLSVYIEYALANSFGALVESSVTKEFWVNASDVASSKATGLPATATVSSDWDSIEADGVNQWVADVEKQFGWN